MRTSEKVHVDNYTRFCLTAITVLLTVLILILWVQGTPSASVARAADDSSVTPARMTGLGEHIADLLTATNQTNQRLTDLIDLLKSGQAKIQVIEADGKHEHK
jgi:uncharacterized membrane protein